MSLKKLEDGIYISPRRAEYIKYVNDDKSSFFCIFVNEKDEEKLVSLGDLQVSEVLTTFNLEDEFILIKDNLAIRKSIIDNCDVVICDDNNIFSVVYNSLLNQWEVEDQSVIKEYLRKYD